MFQRDPDELAGYSNFEFPGWKEDSENFLKFSGTTPLEHGLELLDLRDSDDETYDPANSDEDDYF